MNRLTDEEKREFMELRAFVFEQIRRALEEDGHHKHYEGAMSIAYTFPHYFGDGAGWSINLDCYVFGPNRHYGWHGETFREALSKARAEIESWVRDGYGVGGAAP